MKHELTLRQGFTIIMVGMSGSAREEALRNIFVETFQNRYLYARLAPLSLLS